MSSNSGYENCVFPSVVISYDDHYTPIISDCITVDAMDIIDGTNYQVIASAA